VSLGKAAFSNSSIQVVVRLDLQGFELAQSGRRRLDPRDRSERHRPCFYPLKRGFDGGSLDCSGPGQNESAESN
jgi:hypothetical protein